MPGWGLFTAREPVMNWRENYFLAVLGVLAAVTAAFSMCSSSHRSRSCSLYLMNLPRPIGRRRRATAGRGRCLSARRRPRGRSGDALRPRRCRESRWPWRLASRRSVCRAGVESAAGERRGFLARMPQNIIHNLTEQPRSRKLGSQDAVLRGLPRLRPAGLASGELKSLRSTLPDSARFASRCTSSSRKKTLEPILIGFRWPSFCRRHSVVVDSPGKTVAMSSCLGMNRIERDSSNYKKAFYSFPVLVPPRAIVNLGSRTVNKFSLVF